MRFEWSIHWSQNCIISVGLTKALSFKDYQNVKVPWWLSVWERQAVIINMPWPSRGWPKHGTCFQSCKEVGNRAGEIRLCLKRSDARTQRDVVFPNRCIKWHCSVSFFQKKFSKSISLSKLNFQCETKPGFIKINLYNPPQKVRWQIPSGVARPDEDIKKQKEGWKETNGKVTVNSISLHKTLRNGATRWTVWKSVL